MSTRILVIEDKADNRRILQDLLGSVGYEVLIAENGSIGVDRAIADKPDLILMDIQMPELDGYDATRKIKAHPDGADIPIIAVTSFALSGDEAKTRDAGCDDYVAKPYSPRALLAKVMTYVEPS